MQPPNKAFCPKCGSDIHANTMLQWKKWGDASGVAHHPIRGGDALVIDAPRCVTYRDKIQDLEDQLSDAKKAIEKAKEEAASAPARRRIQACKEGYQKSGKGSFNKSCPKKSKPAPAKPKIGGLFGAKKPRKPTMANRAESRMVPRRSP